MAGLVSAVNDAANQISLINSISNANSAFNAQQASINRQWQEKQNAKAMAFNANEAAKNRDWQEYMSNTAHQREVQDLTAAGLNPVLSAMNGNGASVTSGATASGVTSQGSSASADSSANSAIVNLLGSVLQMQTSLEAANINARTQEAVADKYTAMEQIVAQINKAAALGSAQIHGEATRYASSVSSAATRYAADQSAGASRYGTDVGYQKTERFGNGNYVSHLFGTGSTIVDDLIGSLLPDLGDYYSDHKWSK